jgi:hypothetical protein
MTGFCFSCLFWGVGRGLLYSVVGCGATGGGDAGLGGKPEGCFATGGGEEGLADTTEDCGAVEDNFGIFVIVGEAGLAMDCVGEAARGVGAWTTGEGVITVDSGLFPFGGSCGGFFFGWEGEG